MNSENSKKERCRSRKNHYTFHPFELALEGFPKDVFEKLMDQLSYGYSLAHIQGDVSSEDYIQKKTEFLAYDFVLVEGVGDTSIESIDYQTQVKPFFEKDGIKGVASFVEQKFISMSQKIPVYGLLLAGGYSTRMGSDKALLKYHGKTQVEHCYDLLSQVCSKTFVSKRKEQSFAGIERDFPVLTDRFLDFGPLGGILSALCHEPKAAWLVLACDLPFLDQDTLEVLLDGRNPFKMATAYKNIDKGFPEPLCAIYEPKIITRLLASMGLGYECPKKVLLNSPVELLEQSNLRSLENVNEPLEYQEAILSREDVL
ncbi:MAG: molybdopterin-guanine dinucleotide biosynthesis protein A [Chlamydiales bacterium]|jgi:molybdopterin-guanine dinucleotide biosynthesis protein A